MTFGRIWRKARCASCPCAWAAERGSRFLKPWGWGRQSSRPPLGRRDFRFGMARNFSWRTHRTISRKAWLPCWATRLRGSDWGRLPENLWKRNTVGLRWRGNLRRLWREWLRKRSQSMAARPSLLRHAESVAEPIRVWISSVHIFAIQVFSVQIEIPDWPSGVGRFFSFAHCFLKFLLQ